MVRPFAMVVSKYSFTRYCRASPRLKDADIPEDQFSQLYIALLLTIRKMFHQCKLVHADLSEYNILYHDSQLYIIDVGQSVEHDHPSAFDFLRSDLKNVDEFFGRRGVCCVAVRRAFEFVIGECAVEEDEASWLKRLIEETENGKGNGEAGSARDDDREKQSDDIVFMQSYIPRTLNDVYNPERDVDMVNRESGEKLIYSDVMGVMGAAEGMKKVQIVEPAEVEEGGAESEDVSEDNGSETEDGDGEGFKDRQPRGHRNEDKETKKVRLSFISDLLVLLMMYSGTEKSRQGGCAREAQA